VINGLNSSKFCHNIHKDIFLGLEAVGLEKERAGNELGLRTT
jgi:hypothetical protein